MRRPENQNDTHNGHSDEKIRRKLSKSRGMKLTKLGKVITKDRSDTNEDASVGVAIIPNHVISTYKQPFHFKCHILYLFEIHT